MTKLKDLTIILETMKTVFEKKFSETNNNLCNELCYSITAKQLYCNAQQQYIDNMFFFVKIQVFLTKHLSLNTTFI